jgi:type II secretory pathway pseudopilin PulG
MDAGRRPSEAGYTLVMFVIVIAIMSISMGVAVQTASFQMQREREAELIFRGQQYVEAIRLYKTKYGRYPMRLKEIWEADPRVIRKKWKDPITDSENWGLIYLGQEGGALGQRGRQLVPGLSSESDGGRSDRPLSTQTPGGATAGSRNESGLPEASNEWLQGGAERKMGPIVGVHSVSCDEAVKVYEGHTTYCEWRFIYREQPQQGPGQGGRNRQQRNRGFHPSDWINQQPGDEEPGSGTGSSGGGGPQPPPPIRTPARP